MSHDSVIWLFSAYVKSPALESYFQKTVSAVTAELEAYAESIGANTPWRYINYVNQEQNPLKSYGAENVAFMKEVSKEYDPTGFFQTRVSGGFKISTVE